ncbi:MAG: hypothetical protein WCX29_04105 [Candidatus Peribacteraceae bacterium]|nr:hypothetical protein [Candidatus Peribacteria bacterium]
MRIFALETNRQRLIKRFCYEEDGECVVLQTGYHTLSFFFAMLREIFMTILFFSAGLTAWIFDLPMFWISMTLLLLWVAFVFFNMLKAYIDWFYDFIFVTTDKVVLVDQTSLFKQEIMPIHIEHIGGVSTFTQFWDIFPFGGICIHLKEGIHGKEISKKYVPNAREFAGQISDVITRYQRRNHGKYPPATDAPATQQAAAA